MRTRSLLADYPKLRRSRRSRIVMVGRRTIIAASLGVAFSHGLVGSKRLVFRGARRGCAEAPWKNRPLNGASMRTSCSRFVRSSTRSRASASSSRRFSERRVQVLLARQATVEARQTQVDSLAAATTGSVPSKLDGGQPVEATANAPASSYISGLFQLRLRPAETPPESQSRFDRLKGNLDRFPPCWNPWKTNRSAGSAPMQDRRT